MTLDRKAARALCDNFAGVPVGEIVNIAEAALDMLEEVERMIDNGLAFKGDHARQRQGYYMALSLIRDSLNPTTTPEETP